MLTSLLKNDLFVLLVLCINLLVTISYLFIINNSKIKERFYRLPILVRKIYVLFFVLPLFIAPFLAKSIFYDAYVIKIIGVGLSVTGILFIL